MKQLIWLLFLTGILALCTACTGCEPMTSLEEKNITFSIAAYNVQEFFDAVDDGCEYEEFRKKNYWSKEVYELRLGRLCQVIRALKAEIIVLEEIENEAVLQDIVNMLSGDSWRESQQYNFSCFAKEPGSAIGIGVLSRFPLSGLCLHSMDIRTQLENQPSIRPIMQVQADENGRKLHIFCNHWKSKSGGKEKTEIWREWQESVLSEQLLKASKREEMFTAVLCGDFNRDIKEFKILGNGAEGFGKVLMRTSDPITETFNTVGVISPWLDEKGAIQGSTGSYYYNGEWERIDHMFLYGKGEIKSFSVISNGEWANENGIPLGFKIYTGSGYSDHLPLRMTVKFK